MVQFAPVDRAVSPVRSKALVIHVREVDWNDAGTKNETWLEPTSYVTIMHMQCVKELSGFYFLEDYCLFG